MWVLFSETKRGAISLLKLQCRCCSFLSGLYHAETPTAYLVVGSEYEDELVTGITAILIGVSMHSQIIPHGVADMPVR